MGALVVTKWCSEHEQYKFKIYTVLVLNNACGHSKFVNSDVQNKTRTIF